MGFLFPKSNPEPAPQILPAPQPPVTDPAKQQSAAEIAQQQRLAAGADTGLASTIFTSALGDTSDTPSAVKRLTGKLG